MPEKKTSPKAAESSPLFLDGGDASERVFLDIIGKTAEMIAASFKDARKGETSALPAYSGLEPLALRELIAQCPILPEEGEGFAAVLQKMGDLIMPNLVRTASPGYMAHLHCPALAESVAAELIIAAFNQSMDSWDQAPAATEVEVAVTNELCRLFGFGDGADGVFTSGGSQSNITAIFLARDFFCSNRLHHDIRAMGLPAQHKSLRLYASEVAHFSMEKAAHFLGLGYQAVRKVPVDSKRRMDTAALLALIKEDETQGNIPFCVAATAGTTDYGSIDPLEKIAEICRKRGLWMHTDAAYGSGLIMSKKYKERIRGIELSDSITIDFHKMFLQPISCGAIIIKDGTLFSPLEFHADYLNRKEDEEAGYINLVGKSMQTTRRFDALKVWTSFKARGKKGWDTLISACVENAAYVYKKIAAAPEDFEAVAPPEISSVVFRALPKSGSIDADTLNKHIRKTLLHREGIVTGQTTDEGRVFLKFTLLNPAVTHDDLDRVLAAIVALRDEIELRVKSRCSDALPVVHLAQRLQAQSSAQACPSAQNSKLITFN